MSGASDEAKNFAKSSDFASEKIDAFTAAQRASIKQTSVFKGAIGALKTAMLSIGSMLINMAIAVAVSEAINGFIKLVDYLVVTADEAIKKAAEITAAWDESENALASHKKTLSGLSGEYARLSKGVNTLGGNVSLSAEEFERYQDIANQIADLFPDLVSGWDQQGNAILNTRGSVEGLTQAYDDLIVKQKEAILSGASTVFSGYKASAKNDPKWAWSGDTGYMLEKEYLDNVIKMLESSNSVGAAEYAMKNTKTAGAVGEGLRDAGFDDVSSLTNMEYLKALKTYRSIIVKEADADVRDFQRIADAYLYLSDSYSNFGDSARTAINAVVNGFDYDFISQFSDEKELYAWIEDNIISPFENFDFSNIIDSKSLFDTDKLSVGNYDKLYKDFLSSISDFAPEVQESLTEAFSPDVDALITNVQLKLEDAFDSSVLSFTLGDLRLAASLSIPEDTLWTWEQLLALMAEARTAEAQTIDALAGSIENLTTDSAALNAALSEQGKNGYITYETYKALIDANSAYADSFETVDGVLRLNAESAYALTDANTALALSEAEAGKAAKKAQIGKIAKELAEINEDIASGANFKDEYDLLINQRDALEAKQDLLEDELQQYEAITDQIQGMTAAYTKYLRAKDTPNSGDIYESLSGEKEALDEVIKSGKIVNDDVQSTVDFMLGGSSADMSYEDQLKRAKEARDKYERYFTKDKNGVANFNADLLKKGLATNKNGYTTLNEGVTVADIAKSMGLSEDALKAVFEDMKEYGWKFDWSTLFPDVSELEEPEVESVIDVAAQALVDQAGAYGEYADKAAKIITYANEKIADALAGNTPTPGSDTLSVSGSGSVSVFTAGQSNESTSPPPQQGQPSPIYQTIYVNVATGDPISPAQLLIGITENEDGTLSYDVAANAAAKDVLSKNDLVLNANEDGSYDVSVHAKSGNTVNAGGLVLGTDVAGEYSVTTNAEGGDPIAAGSLVLGTGLDGEYYVTANAMDGDPIDASGLVLGTTFDGEYYVKTNAEPGGTVGLGQLVVGLNTFDDSLGVTVNSTVGQTATPSDLLPNATTDFDGSLFMGVNIKPVPDPVSTSDILPGISESENGTPYYDVDVKVDADPVLAKDILPGVSENTDGSLSYDVDVNIGSAPLSAKAILPGVTENDDGSLSYDVMLNVQGGDGGGTSVPSSESLTESPSVETIEPVAIPIEADTTPLENNISTFRDSLSKDDQIILDVFMETTSTDGMSWWEFTAAFLEFKKQTLVIPADIDARGLYNKIDAFEGSLTGFVIPVGSDTDEAYEKALALKKKIEEMAPTMKVVIKTNVPGYASGTKHAKAGVALTGEEEPELIEHRDDGSWSYVEKPTLVDLKDGDVVHSGSDTKEILKRGIKPYVLSGRSFMDGSEGSGSPVGGSGPTITPTTSTKKKKSSSSSWAKYFEKLFDWIEVRLSKLSKFTENWTRQIKKAIGYFNQNKAVDSAITSIEDQIKALNKAAKKYQSQADAVAKKSKLSNDIVKKIQNGTLDISSYDDKTKAKIKEYQEWYEKAQKAKDAILDLEDQQKELNAQKFDNISKQYKNMQGVVENAAAAAQSAIDLLIAQGKEVKESDYSPLIENQTKAIANLREEQEALKKEFGDQLSSGVIVEGSDAWYEYKSTIEELDSAILDATTDLIALNDTVKNLTITNLGYQLENLTEQEAVIQRQLDLIESQGGTATDSLYEDLIAIGFSQIEILKAQNVALSDQLVGLDPMSEKYQDISGQIRDNYDAINDVVTSQEQWNDSVYGLKIDEINRVKDALSEANDEYQRQADLQKAIEDLERARSQRQVRILENGTFKYVADQEAIADAQKNLDDKRHDETMAKFDEAIETLEELKKSSNVYETLGLTQIDPKELIASLGVDDFLKSVIETTNLGAMYADLIAKATTATSATGTPAAALGSPMVNVTFAAGSVVTGANPDDVVSAIARNLAPKLEQELYKK